MPRKVAPLSIRATSVAPKEGFYQSKRGAGALILDGLTHLFKWGPPQRPDFIPCMGRLTDGTIST